MKCKSWTTTSVSCGAGGSLMGVNNMDKNFKRTELTYRLCITPEFRELYEKDIIETLGKMNLPGAPNMIGFGQMELIQGDGIGASIVDVNILLINSTEAVRNAVEEIMCSGYKGERIHEKTIEQ